VHEVFEITERSLNMARSYWEDAENNKKYFNVRKKARDPGQCSGES